MTIRWFGEPWPSEQLRAPLCENDAYRIVTPVGAMCIHCRELIEEGDRGEESGNRRYVHRECGLRSALGNHLHVAGDCKFLGDCVQRSTLTYRQEAIEVWRLVHEQGDTADAC